MKKEMIMKTINKISIFILLLALLFVGCRKDTNPVVEPKVKEQSKEVYDTKAIFEWVVDFPGIISSVVEVGLKADMSDAVRYGSIKETTEKSFTAVANNLKEDTKYYYRYVVWNPNGSFNMEVNVFETYPPIPTYTIQLSANPNNGGTVSGGGKFKQGQSCTVTATPATDYYFINWTEGENVVSTDTSYIFEVTGNRTLKANFIERPLIPTGAINGLFSVSATQQVYFSQGNLQYIGNTNTWKFADHQWDVIGESQGNSSQGTTRDLFGWGTSGYDHGAVCYQPWSTSTTYSDYYAYGQYTYNLFDQTGKADWGYNAISNGGNQENSGWRTLTHGEWVYVFNTRSTSSGIRYARANVNNVNGVILLPDDWSTSYYALNSTNSGGASFTTNTISSSQWNTLEQHGAVFLPAAGYRYGTSFYGVGFCGDYWSASYGNNGAWHVYFGDGGLNTDGYDYRNFGFSVRLVRSVQ